MYTIRSDQLWAIEEKMHGLSMWECMSIKYGRIWAVDKGEYEQ